MPYELKREGSGYKIVSKDTGKTHSDKPLPRQRALAQMRALYANVPDAQTDMPAKARGGKINLSGKQKKSKPVSSKTASTDMPPEPNGLPPLMALHKKP